mmetsp:Transcript_32029/g.74883  ORF Transcript_32029/g.74883 Transcript_32029/m.74883 type:complete len:232 (+) Transcript_32029:618-1313(+)
MDCRLPRLGGAPLAALSAGRPTGAAASRSPPTHIASRSQLFAFRETRPCRSKQQQRQPWPPLPEPPPAPPSPPCSCQPPSPYVFPLLFHRQAPRKRQSIGQGARRAVERCRGHYVSKGKGAGRKPVPARPPHQAQPPSARNAISRRSRLPATLPPLLAQRPQGPQHCPLAGKEAERCPRARPRLFYSPAAAPEPSPHLAPLRSGPEATGHGRSDTRTPPSFPPNLPLGSRQ